MENKARAHIFVSGRVQGVFFRENTKNKAKSFGITGWIRNLPDGRVEAVLEEEKDQIEELIKWIKKGPIIARVDDVDVAWEEYQGEFKDFEIRYN